MRRWEIICITLIFLIAATVFTSCEEEDESPTKPRIPNVICPLSVGNYWTYIDSVFLEGITTVSESRIDVTGDTVITYEDEDYHVYYWTWYLPAPCHWLVQNGEEGLWTLGTASDSDTLYYRTLFAKYPVSSGEVWEKSFYTCWIYGEIVLVGSINAECISVDYTYETPLGTFKCICCHEQYYFNQTLMDFYYYFVPRIGLVSALGYSDGVYTSKKVLTGYNLE